MKPKIIMVLLLCACLSLIVQGQAESDRFVLLTSSRSVYLFDGVSANKITGDDWVITFTTVENGILLVTDTVNGQNILQYDLNGQFQTSLTNFNSDNTPIWIDIVDIPTSHELIAEFEVIGTLEGGLYRFDPDDVQSSLELVELVQFSNPDVSSDGRQLVFNKNVQRLTDSDTLFVYSAIVLYDLETTAWLYATSELQGHCGGARWHPTQNKIVYSCRSNQNTLRIYVTDIDTAETVQLPLPEEDVFGCAVVWSPDGSAIAYNTASGITILTLETMSFQFLTYPSKLIEQGVACLGWISN